MFVFVLMVKMTQVNYMSVIGLLGSACSITSIVFILYAKQFILLLKFSQHSPFLCSLISLTCTQTPPHPEPDLWFQHSSLWQTVLAGRHWLPAQECCVTPLKQGVPLKEIRVIGSASRESWGAGCLFTQPPEEVGFWCDSSWKQPINLLFHKMPYPNLPHYYRRLVCLIKVAWCLSINQGFFPWFEIESRPQS